MTKKQIAATAKKVNSGEIQLPDITLDNDEDWFSLWEASRTQFGNVD